MTVEPEELTCGCCKQERKKAGLSPRARVPVVFQKDKEPVLLCEYCDGDALRFARTLEEKHTSGE